MNPRTGQAVAGGRVTTGNVYSGQSGSAGYVRSQSGGAARVGNDLYASHDGTVYRNSGGGWQQNSGGGWGNVSESTRTQALDHEQQIRWRAPETQASTTFGPRVDMLEGCGAISRAGRLPSVADR